MEEQQTFLSQLEQGPLNQYIIEVRGYAGELTMEIAPENLVEVMKTLKEMFAFNYLADITATDHYTDEKRFEVSYNLASIPNKQRLRISVRLEESDPTVDSITSLWTSANWFEREAYDMLGIKFHGNEDLRRIYMPEDFDYFPLRKEFPLLGIPGTIQLPEKDPPKEYK
ncbi:MAG: NADH-quinone oxidoreductase subunit C [Bacteroidota bacterium]